MAVILSKDGEEVVTKIKKKIVGVRCDVCKHDIPLIKYGDNACKYFRVMTGHRDWGNDSCESIEYRDICQACLNTFVNDYFTDDGYYTSYLEIETEYAYPSYKYE